MRNTIRQLLYSRPGTNNLKWLFANGEVGAWYDPRDLSTLFQTSTGTTAVTAGEQPAGLVLDKSKGLVLGSEKAPTGTVSDFVATGTASIVGDVFNIPNNNDEVRANTGSEVVDRWYLVEWVVTGIAGQTINVALRNYSAATETSAVFTLTGSQQTLRLYRLAPANGSIRTRVQKTVTTTATSITFHSYSVREIPGSHALQSSSTVRPTYKTGPDRLYFDADPDSLTITFPSAPGNSTVAYGVAGGAPVITYPVNISGTTYAIDPSVIGTFGPELVTNGGFDADSGWTKATGVTIESGQAKYASVASGGVNQSLSGVTLGATYKLTLTISGRTVGGISARIGTGSFTAVGSADGTYTVYLVATGSSTLSIAASTNPTTLNIDNISVRELIGSGANNTGLVIVNRALTNSEKSRLTAYFKNKS